MPRRTTVKHPQDQLHAVARAWFLEVIRTDCPKVLDDRCCRFRGSDGAVRL